MCDFAYETTEHFLFECPKLLDLREVLLPPAPYIANTLFGTVDQFELTSRYLYMAQRRRAQAQFRLDQMK